MEAALTVSMSRTSHEIFSGHFVSFVVKKIPLSTTYVLHRNYTGLEKAVNCIGGIYS